MDELAQYILSNESLEEDKAKEIVEECYSISDTTSLLKRTSKVEDSFRELEFVEYNFHEGMYKLSNQNVQEIN